MKLDSAIQEQLAALVAEEELRLLATEVVGSGSKMVLRLVVDGADGVSLDQCAAISRQASVILDVEDPIGHRYTLEVSSPGLDRKLYDRSDFDRYAGHRIKVRMAPSYRDHRVVVGELIGLEGENVCIHAESGTEIELPVDQVFEARLEVDWNAVMKEGKSRS
jgi:ribosome maturation factor RimP